MTEGARAGDVVGGRYQLVQSIASGGMGRVWKAYDARLQTDVAVKELWLTGPMAPEQRAALLKRAELEALSAVRLRDHPNIVTVHDVVVEHDIPWIVMQLVSGGTLQQRLSSGPLEIPDVARIAAALLGALDAAHKQGIVHRDVKPANVMITDDDQILLGDFGIAAPETGTGITSTGVVIGSAPYLAPERAAGRPGKASSDLFSLGVTLYEAVEGVSPFLRDSWVASAHAVRYDAAPPMRRAGRLGPLISALLSKDPAARPKIAVAMALLTGDERPQQEQPEQEQPKPKPWTPTEVVAPPVVTKETTPGKVTLTVTNQCGEPARLHLGVDHLGWVADGRTTIFETGPAAARTLRVNTGKLGTVSRVLQLETRHPVHLTVRREGGELLLTGDGILQRPPKRRPPTTTPPPPRPGTSNRTRPAPETPPTPPPAPPADPSTARNWAYAAAALAAALLLYAFSPGFSGWVSHYLHGSAASAKVGDCVHRDKQDWVKVPCWSGADKYAVRTTPVDVLSSTAACPYRMERILIDTNTYVCAEPK
ncbi:serine/threonine-protein kinase [Streptomyces sp. NPDC001678]|uniref:serine/threonine-protein kinase n=1 Tax=Streptomyces sp. NPDC001678 TaxID=3364599 RepID=UPI003680B12B